MFLDTMKNYSLKDHLGIIRSKEAGESIHSIHNRMNCSRTMIQKVLRRKNKILDALAAGKSDKLKRLKKVKYLDVELSLLPWIKEARSQNIPITGDLMRVRFYFLGCSRSIGPLFFFSNQIFRTKR